MYGVFTNTAPTDADRGAGRPEALFFLERMVDVIAQELGLDPVEVRKKNLLPPGENIKTVTGLWNLQIMKVLENSRKNLEKKVVI